ncbi:MAG: phosphoribosylformylglycinamidine synthase subunit PurL [Acidimicrobiia bacterium]
MVDPDRSVHRALGLTDDEHDRIVEVLGRPPNHLELAMYSVMWSEHCSYKSSRIHLGRLPTDAPWVVVPPGEGAGVLDVGDGIGAAIRIESHNHPSAIEPYQGAATGVGGILRDIFSMGARPIAVMDTLCFGPLEEARSRWVAEGVVSGVSGYGNSVGVPTVGGETVFDETYADNPLVNVLCLGLLPLERLVLGRAEGVGNLAVLLGSSTGRDGIGGVSVLASAGFGDAAADAAKRPSVQVGDPFEEKRLIEACLALLDAGLAVGVQDLGGAGLTCATSETAAKGGAGMDVYVDAVHQREPGMAPFEVMTSESQERMLAIVRPEHLDEVLAIAARWEVTAVVVGTVTGTGRLRVLDRDGAGASSPGGDGCGAQPHGSTVLADMPARSLEEDAPRYDRPRTPPVDLAARWADQPEFYVGLADTDRGRVSRDLLAMLADTAWVSSQYDHQLFLNTVQGPGADAAVLRLKHPVTGLDTGRALALTTDSNHRWCAVDPRAGTAALVAESVANLAVSGARPLAVVNCLNFGNPEHPEVMWQLAEAIDGMAEACRALAVPVVGGNVSLYNESRGRDIDPTPVVGLLGVVDRLERRPPGAVLVAGARLVVLGPATTPALAGSRWAWSRQLRGGRLPVVDFVAHGALCDLVRDLVGAGLPAGVHDVGDGGLVLALAEMAVRSGVGFEVSGPAVADVATLFGEAPARVVLAVAPDRVAEVEDRAAAAGVTARWLGTAGGRSLGVEGLMELSLVDAAHAWGETLPTALGHGTTQG